MNEFNSTWTDTHKLFWLVSTTALQIYKELQRVHPISSFRICMRACVCICMGVRDLKEPLFFAFNMFTTFCFKFHSLFLSARCRRKLTVSQHWLYLDFRKFNLPKTIFDYFRIGTFYIKIPTSRLFFFNWLFKIQVNLINCEFFVVLEKT